MACPIHAAQTINSVTLDGGTFSSASPYYVFPGQTITVVVNATLTGSSKWLSSAAGFNTGAIPSTGPGWSAQPSQCFSITSPTGGYSSAGTFTQNFTYTVQPTPTGTLNAFFGVFNNASCGGTQDTVTWPNAIVVVTPLPPTAGKGFSPSTIAINGTSTLAITLTNPNAVPITGVAFIDNYPANTKNTGAPGLTNTCGGTATAVANGTALALSGGTIPAGGSCSLTVQVTATASGSYLNSTGTVTTTNAGNGTAATATLSVASASAAPSGFNAFETGTAAGSVTGVIRTKIASSAFSLAIVALKSSGTAVETAFAGDVKVELVDASAGGSCGAYGLIRNLGALTFTAADMGRKTLADISESNAWPNARVRMTYPATGVPTITACSTDNFAIRPESLAVSAHDNDWQSPGINRTLANMATSGGNVHKAGQPFTLHATGLNALKSPTGNYTGSPTLKTLACTLPAAPCINGILTPGVWSGSGTVTSSSASYSETGSFNLTLEDQTFANVDSADSTLLERTIPQAAAVPVGRFVPNHFELTTASTPDFKTFNDTTCASRSFTYAGQPFGYLTLPEATITAKNAAGGTTLNYTGALWKLAPADVTQAYAAVTGTLDTGLVGTPTVAATGSGVGSLIANAADVIAFVRTTPVAPFAADITLTMTIQDIAENGVPGNGVINTTTPAVFSSIAFDSGNDIRFGQLVLSNAHGSELLKLPVPIETRFWNGSGFARNTADACTQLAAAHVALSGWKRDLNACETSVSLSGRFNAGRGSLRFSAPGAGNTGSVDLTLQLGATASGSTCAGGATLAPALQSWLQGRWTGGDYDQNPAARASFGLHRGSKSLIYLREMH